MKNSDFEDKQLSCLLKNELPDAPFNPWFTRTVLNRLPERKRKTAANIEIYVCIIAAIITLTFLIKFSIGAYYADTITIMNLIIFFTYCGLFAALVANAAIPLIKRNITHR